MNKFIVLLISLAGCGQKPQPEQVGAAVVGAAFARVSAMVEGAMPLVPFVVWFGAAINWLVVVGEAVIAAPLWALTHLRGEGDAWLV